MNSVMTALTSVPTELPERPESLIVMLRQQRRLLLLENRNLRLDFLVAVGIPGWEIPIGSFRELLKIDRPVLIYLGSGERVVR